MTYDFLFFLNSIGLGIGLAMDAFSVSIVSGLTEPCMKRRKMFGVAGTFALFQIAMPLIGWVLVHTAEEHFSALHKYIPYISLILLVFIGVKLIVDGLKERKEREKTGTCENRKIAGFWQLMLLGVATSIDALSVGFTIADYTFPGALIESLIIGIVTFAICIGGVLIGRKFGDRLVWRASILGGIILILIGIEIFVKGLLGF